MTAARFFKFQKFFKYPGIKNSHSNTFCGVFCFDLSIILIYRLNRGKGSIVAAKTKKKIEKKLKRNGEEY